MNIWEDVWIQQEERQIKEQRWNREKERKEEKEKKDY